MAPIALVGRAGEVERVVEMVRGVAAGQAATILVSGEAGVGKTALVGEACSEVAAIADVVWSSCLPLTSFAVPFFPLVSGLRAWAARRHVAVPAVLRGSDGQPAGDAPVQFDAWLDEACRRRPMVLVVDDLHWADQSSLDVLMYVVAGPTDRRVAVVATLRTGEVGEGHPLRRWLAHVRRLPGVDEFLLGRLDRAATDEQLAGLLGRTPHQALVDAVFARARGNAYLTTLLARGLPPDSTALPAGLPTALREAVAQSWLGLSLPARESTRLLAVAGRPQRAENLEQVARLTGIAADIVPLLREAVDDGVLEVGPDRRYWFAHPLLAEVLEEALLPEERRSRHAAFAAASDPGSAEDVDVERAVALADHHHQAGHREQAYRWALLGADAADEAGGATEALRLLRRALELHAEVYSTGVTRFDLLQRIRTVAERAGEHEQELAALEDILALVDRELQPLLATDLLVRRMHLRYATGQDWASLADATETVRESAGHPSSAQHALAVAQLARVEMFHVRPSGRARAHEAVDLATACGSASALTYALTARAMARYYSGTGGGLVDAERAQAAATEVGDYWAFTLAVFQACNSMDCTASRPVIEYMRQSREHLTSIGAPHTYIAWLSSAEAYGLLLLGEWRTCVERLRVVLGSTPGPVPDMFARLTSALLACRQGLWTEAQAHLDRAEELFAEVSRYPSFAFAVVRAELAIAAGDTERATAVALAGVPVAGKPLPPGPIMVERLVTLAARAAADEVQALRDRGVDPSSAGANLLSLQRRFPNVVTEAAQPGPMYAAQARAMQALYEAELLRGQLNPAAAAGWSRAAQSCAQAELPWDEAYAQWRAAQSGLADRSNRDVALTALRRAHELATDLQAAPLLADIEALARSATVALDANSIAPLPATATLVPGLTPREREVLTLVVAGRTYRQISREMMISEKTVSVHISNLLRKTSTSNRIELAQLVRRLASHTPQ
jgi:DNA-binding CsgD family transcriptional regulator/tetratricopeptide (TPR) repeat protein